ncbi:MAG: DUF2231 domain-containing protein [Candidatus Omnitrophica bacterium]|nr:DUF2231 domain-containing protein [Candidatus Omnitrophota bacterium]
MSEYLHPMVAHFPIVLVLAAFASESLALLGRMPAWHTVSLWNLGAATLSTIAAMITGGLAAPDLLSLHPEAERILTEHIVWTSVATFLIGSVFAWRFAQPPQTTRAHRLAALGLLFICCLVTAYAAHQGGMLVFEHGVGVDEHP